MSPFRFRRLQLDVTMQYSVFFREEIAKESFYRVETKEPVRSVYRVLAQGMGRGLPALVREYGRKYGRTPAWKENVYHVTVVEFRKVPGEPRSKSVYVTYLLRGVRVLRSLIGGEAVREVMEE